MTGPVSTGKGVADEAHITRCPHCDTSFRVTDAQLAAARGAVRCGACLLVFTATEHLVLPPAEEPEAPDDVVPSEDHAIRSGDDEFETDTVVDTDTDTDTDADVGLPETDEPAAPAYGDNDLAWEPEDLSEWVNPASAPPAWADSVVFNADGVIDDEELERISGDMAEDAGIETSERPTDDDMEADHAAPAAEAIEAPAVDHGDDGDIEPAIESSGEPSPELADASSPEPLPDLALDEQADEPQFAPEPRRPAWRWWFASAALLVLLGVQYAWFERDRYATDPAWRDAYLAVCGVLSCALPEYSDPSALGINGLVIRTHPTRQNALRVDALLNNEAPYRQAFPSLRLQFADIQNNRVAMRVFRPEEYLAGEMAGLRYIPGQTEVRVSLEIVDPGENAVNYSLEIL